jgi:protein-S-isoprenylcysteine O-methyltransferase Ste14
MAIEQNAPPAPPARRRFPAFVTMELALDLAERAAVLLLFLLFVNRMLPRLVQLVLIQREHPEVILLAAGVNAQALLLVLSEFLGVLLIVIRRRSASLSSHPLDWALSFSAVSAPLLLTTPAVASAFIPETLVTMLMLMGLLVQISGKFALGRSFGLVPANRGVKTHGLYRLVRHPIYAGYTLTHIGFLLGFPSLQNAALYAGIFTIEVMRLMREEAVLKRDPAYVDYAARVRYRLMPGVF